MEAQAGFSGRVSQSVQHVIVQRPRCRRRRLGMPHVIRAANVLVSNCMALNGAVSQQWHPPALPRLC